jgi:UDP:flavonoid glycosyltransferase YjiC (YdhE family)
LGLGHLETLATRSERDSQVFVVRWNTALARLRKDFGLSRKPLPCASLLLDATSILGMFPAFLMSERRKLLPNLDLVGYAEYEQPPAEADEELLAFCDDQTVVFSFGSFADACSPYRFFEESVAACRMSGLKCVYISRFVDPAAVAASAGDVLLRQYVPHRRVFPSAGAIVHHGGTGTLALACEYAKPMVIVPFLFDQPLHAARMHSLVGAEIVPAATYDRVRIASALDRTFRSAAQTRERLVALRAGHSDGAQAGAHRILAAVRGERTHSPRIVH